MVARQEAGIMSWLIVLTIGILILQMVASDPRPDSNEMVRIEEELKELERRPRAAEGSIEEYLESCGITFRMSERKLVKFTSPFYGTDKQYPANVSCKWDFVGDAECIPELTCKEFELAPQSDGTCDDEHLRVSDGVGGEEDMCGQKSFDAPIRASKGSRDLFATFQSNPEEATGKFKGFSCEVSCSKNPGAAKDLVANDDVRKEEFGCICGLRNQDDRIVGGEDVSTMAEYPWQAAIVFAGTRQPKCGGSVLNSRFILTAAHCFALEPTTASQVEVLIHAQVLDAAKMAGASKKIKLGEKGSLQASGYLDRKRTDKDENTQRYKVAELITHPLFTDKFDFDVALVRLETEIDLKSPDAPTPICLPYGSNYSNLYEGTVPTVVGWGLADENAGGTTRRLQKLDVPVIPLARCQSWTNMTLTQRMMCAGYEEGKKDACTGDSGGPLVYQKPDKQWEQIGVVSWGEGCARAHRPGLYSRVTEFEQWIRQHANKVGKWCRESRVIPD